MKKTGRALIAEMNLHHPGITWYGPYQCPACLNLIIKASKHDGGLELDCPTLVYPNTVWQKHRCQVDLNAADRAELDAIFADRPNGIGPAGSDVSTW